MADPLPGGVQHLDQSSSNIGAGVASGGALPFLNGVPGTPSYDPFGFAGDSSGFPSSEFILTGTGKPPSSYEVHEARGDVGAAQQADTKQVDSFLKGLAQDPKDLASLQLALVGAGFNVDPSGSMDDNTMSVLGKLIGEAQRDNMSLVDVIQAHARANKDPSRRAKSLAAQGQNEFEQQLVASYISWWGIPPTQGWITAALKSNQNLFEIEYAEKSKPAYANSPAYQNNRNQLNGGLAGGALSTQTFTGSGNPFSPGAGG